MSRDVMIYQPGSSDEHAALMAWAKNANGIHDILEPSYHRLQIERWVWSLRNELGHRVMDVGQSELPRSWISDGYFTFGLDHESDVVGDLLNIPMESGSVDGVLMTEVLEHVIEPMKALSEVHRVMKPGALILVATPFMWPWHGRSDYDDYWRFTHQGLEVLMKDFEGVVIKEHKWTDEGLKLYNLLRRFECFGFASNVRASTGFMLEARKGS